MMFASASTDTNTLNFLKAVVIGSFGIKRLVHGNHGPNEEQIVFLFLHLISIFVRGKFDLPAG